MVEHFTSTLSCVSLFFLSRTNFPQKGCGEWCTVHFRKTSAIFSGILWCQELSAPDVVKGHYF